jgi:hypothetical protein
VEEDNQELRASSIEEPFQGSEIYKGHIYVIPNFQGERAMKKQMGDIL